MTLLAVRTLLLLILCAAEWGCAESPSNEPDSSGVADGTPLAASDGSAVDFSGIELFWQIVDLLSQDEEPSPELWRALFATPGYRALTRSEFEPSFFQGSFRLAYMPSLSDSLATALEEGRDGRLLRHYRQVEERRAELEAFAKDLKRSGPMEEPSRLAGEWLPHPSPEEPAPLALVVFDLDARGYDPIVIDVMAAKELDLLSFLAHESHHWYRNDRAMVDWDGVAPHDEELLWTLYQIQGEGIADQIDKRSWIDGGAPVPAAREAYATDYIETLAATPATIRELDSLLAALGAASEEDHRAGIGTRFAALVPMSGHPTGYYMARMILEVLGRERLVIDVANPVAFFQAYDEAARASGAQGLSPEALRSLAELEAPFTRVRSEAR
jgi:hypothetical protein